jgi:hypothetical protein
LKLKEGDMSTVAETLVATLAAVGIERIYGIVGDSPRDLSNALSHPNEPIWVSIAVDKVHPFGILRIMSSHRTVRIAEARPGQEGRVQCARA